jgi:lysozyme
VRRSEGFVDHIYLCPAGHETIGWGHRLTAADTVLYHTREANGRLLTAAEGTQLLRDDLAAAEDAVRRLVAVPLRQSQFDALVSFVFNVGQGAFARSTLLRRLNAGEDPTAVAGEFGRWVYVGPPGAKRVHAGLADRRAAEAALWLAGW